MIRKGKGAEGQKGSYRRTALPPYRRMQLLAVRFGLLLVVMLVPSASVGQKGREDVKEGNRLYGEGRYAEAHEKYLDALRDAPDSPLIRYNEGNALYQTEEFQRAMEAYRGAIESGDPTLLSDAWYNVGNSLYRAQQLPEALEAYKETLRHDPSDVDAKHNLERVLQMIQEQQQQQDQKGQEGQEQQQDQEGQEQQQQQQQQQGQEGQQPDQQQQQPDQQQQRQQQQQQQGQEGQHPQTQPGQMTREEAERLLQAIQEDPSKVQRQRAPNAGRRRPRKDW
jgi:tetratricopeptide (TPR) repeat protein